ncbi:MAG TPA: VOC family protein [Roseiarcus sp.]|nr:VOC family protein [Roseiarcus sp.]
MPRALDHLVIASRDLDAVAEAYRRLGFQVGPRNRHPWGTENHIVQFPGAFLELVGLGEGFHRPAPDDALFAFAGFLDVFLAARQGLAMLALRSDDAKADRRAFSAGGLGDFPRFDFGRKGMRQGREVEVAFSLAFARCPALPQTGFFVCQQHFPQHFWDAAAQVHPNGATGVAGLVFVHPKPQATSGFLAGFLEAPAQAIEGGLRFEAEGATVECLTPAAFAAAWGAPTPCERGLAAMRIAARRPPGIVEAAGTHLAFVATS